MLIERDQYPAQEGGSPRTSADLRPIGVSGGCSNRYPRRCASCPVAGECPIDTTQIGSAASTDVPFFDEASQFGEYIFHRGEEVKDLIVLRRGTLKMCVTSRGGREQVLSFYFPGDVVGIENLHSKVSPGDVVALENSEFCRVSIGNVLSVWERHPKLQMVIVRRLASRLSTVTRLAGDYSVEERAAAFLLNLMDRMSPRVATDGRCQLPMSRADIANHLRMAPETVSRVFGRFHRRGWMDVSGRYVRITDAAAMTAACSDALPR